MSKYIRDTSSFYIGQHFARYFREYRRGSYDETCAEHYCVPQVVRLVIIFKDGRRRFDAVWEGKPFVDPDNNEMSAQLRELRNKASELNIPILRDW